MKVCPFAVSCIYANLQINYVKLCLNLFNSDTLQVLYVYFSFLLILEVRFYGCCHPCYLLQGWVGYFLAGYRKPNIRPTTDIQQITG